MQAFFGKFRAFCNGTYSPCFNNKNMCQLKFCICKAQEHLPPHSSFFLSPIVTFGLRRSRKALEFQICTERSLPTANYMYDENHDENHIFVFAIHSATSQLSSSSCCILFCSFYYGGVSSKRSIRRYFFHPYRNTNQLSMKHQIIFSQQLSSHAFSFR